MMLRLMVVAAIAGCCCSGCGDRRSADAEGALPYEGLPLYAGRVDLPESGRFPDAAYPAERVLQLQQALDDALRHTKAVHMGASVATLDAVWSETRTAPEATAYGRFYWASVGKALTAVVVMQLVEERKIDLSDPVSRWFPDLPYARSMTIDHLLSHTSGLFSANEDAGVRADPRYLTPEMAIDISIRHGALFRPGQHWRYSNTGYSMLGRIIEAVDGVPYHEAVNRRIAQALGLATLRALAPEELPSDVAPIVPSDGSVPQIAPSWPYAAGAVVGSADDMVRFWHAVLTRRLLGPESTALLFERLYPMFDQGTYYGRGVMLYALPDGQGGSTTWVGHSGGTPGAKAVVAYAMAQRAFVAVALSGDGSAEATANLLLRQLE